MLDYDMVVIGGGISGLATSAFLKSTGKRVVLLEKTERVGGCITTIEDGGFLFEVGPNTVLNNSLNIDELCFLTDCLRNRITAGRVSKKRYIYRGGELIPLPSGPISFFRTPLFSTGAKLRLLKEPFIGRAHKEETIAEFTERRLGREFLKYAVGPFVSGVYAGDPKRLSVRYATRKIYALEERYRSLFIGALAKRKGPQPAGGLFSFKRGLKMLPDAIHEYLGDFVLLNASCSAIIPDKDGTFTVAFSGGNIKSKAIILALPSLEVSTLLTPIAKDADKISHIEYAPVVTVSLGFEKKSIRHSLEGFGFLVPRGESPSILGCLFVSSLFEGRAPVDHVALSCFLGGATEPEWVMRSDKDIIERVLSDLNMAIGLLDEPLFLRIDRWQKAIPQYNISYGRFIETALKIEREFPNLKIGGNLFNGVSIGDCIVSAKRICEEYV